jgi:adenosylmethionine---8-amino-7-oxononanoate aminotransferase
VLEFTEPRLNWYDAGIRHVRLPGSASGSPLSVVAAYGTRVVLEDESELLDGTAAGGAACHGFSHPHIGMGIARQLERMAHLPLDGILHPEAAKLAQRLARLLPGDLDHVTFAESASSAVEGALKMATQYWAVRGAAARRKFVAFKGAHHGDTAGAMSVSDSAAGSAQYRKLVPRQFLVPLPADPESTLAFETFVAERAHQLAGIVVEPLVQRGTMRFHNTSCLRRIRAVADRHDLLLIFDESFTGFGRLGAMFACLHAGVTPDIVVLANALTGGALPLATTVACRKVADILSAAQADPRPDSFAGNALACAAANASLDLFQQEPRLDQAAEIGRRLSEGLGQCRDLPGVADVRVKGALGVVELDASWDATELRERFVEAGVFLRPHGNMVCLTPALTIEPYDLSTLVGTVVKVLAESADGRAARLVPDPEQAVLPL